MLLAALIGCAALFDVWLAETSMESAGFGHFDVMGFTMMVRTTIFVEVDQ